MTGLRSERLTDFIKWVSEHISGDEKGEAQIFLDRLFIAFGHKGIKEAGATLEMRVSKGAEGGTAFADLVWKPIVVIEMKKRGEDLRKHYRQAFEYWTRLVPGRPRYAVLCNFDEFWIYDFETQMDTPVDQLKVCDLEKRYGPLAFLFVAPEEPIFGNHHEEVTRKAADLLASCFNKLITRKIERGLAQLRSHWHVRSTLRLNKKANYDHANDRERRQRHAEAGSDSPPRRSDAREVDH